MLVAPNMKRKPLEECEDGELLLVDKKHDVFGRAKYAVAASSPNKQSRILIYLFDKFAMGEVLTAPYSQSHYASLGDNYEIEVDTSIFSVTDMAVNGWLRLGGEDFSMLFDIPGAEYPHCSFYFNDSAVKLVGNSDSAPAAHYFPCWKIVLEGSDKPVFTFNAMVKA